VTRRTYVPEVHSPRPPRLRVNPVPSQPHGDASGAHGGHRGWLFSGRHSSWGDPLSLERRSQAVLGGAGPGASRHGPLLEGVRGGDVLIAIGNGFGTAKRTSPPRSVGGSVKMRPSGLGFEVATGRAAAEAAGSGVGLAGVASGSRIGSKQGSFWCRVARGRTASSAIRGFRAH
jgi:hypothetical protein